MATGQISGKGRSYERGPLHGVESEITKNDTRLGLQRYPLNDTFNVLHESYDDDDDDGDDDHEHD
eukprot:12414961-Karenia_brevis.AAC.1